MSAIWWNFVSADFLHWWKSFKVHDFTWLAESDFAKLVKTFSNPILHRSIFSLSLAFTKLRGFEIAKSSVQRMSPSFENGRRYPNMDIKKQHHLNMKRKRRKKVTQRSQFTLVSFSTFGLVWFEFQMELNNRRWMLDHRIWWHFWSLKDTVVVLVKKFSLN